MTRRRSEELFERARSLMPGGVNSPVRAFRSVGGTPVFFEKASGATFEDADGNTIRIDGPVLIGPVAPSSIFVHVWKDISRVDHPVAPVNHHTGVGVFDDPHV